MLQLGANFLQPGWQSQGCAKALQSLVSCKAGRISRNFKQHAAGFAKVNGAEILTVDDWRNVVVEFRQRISPLQLLVICRGSPCHVMDGPHRNPSRSSLGRANQIDATTGSFVPTPIPESVSLLATF